jgi:hypothetical protein
MISELERRLTTLGAALEVPPVPDLATLITPRLPERSRRRGRPARRAVALALLAAVLLAGVAFAVPASRHAILRVLGLRGASIERVSHLPPAEGVQAARLGLGQPISLSRARHAASFSALLPTGPAAAYLKHDVPGGRLSFLTGHLLLIEFRGSAMPFILKLIGPGTRAQRLQVNRGPGVYLSGAPHELLFQQANGAVQADPTRLAGNVLIWQQGPLIVRIEGTHTLAQALMVARSLR